ncbi:hypothetical protein Tco_0753082 [Tanacetum coccineum]
MTRRTAYTTLKDPQGVIYVDKLKRKRFMRTDELHKFSDDTLISVRDDLHQMLSSLRLGHQKAVAGKANYDKLGKVRWWKGIRGRPQAATMDHRSDTNVFAVKMEILQEPTSNKLCVSEIVTHWFTHIVLSALRRSGIENGYCSCKTLSRRFF